MQNVIETEKRVSIVFESMSDFFAYSKSADMPNINMNLFNNYMKPTRTVSCDSHGPSNKTNQDVLDHALLGDAHLCKILEGNYIAPLDAATGKNTNSHKQVIKAVSRRRKFADQGDELDMDKVYSGQLDTCWSKTERVEFDKEHNMVTLLVDNGANWNIGATETFWTSAIVCRLIKELEAAGKSVRLVLLSHGNNPFTGSRKDIVTCAIVKETNERMNMEKIAGMTNLGFFRTLTFGMMCASPIKLCDSLGYHVDVSMESIPAQFEEDVQKGHMKFVIVPQARSINAAIRGLENCYKQLTEGGAK